MDDLGEGYVKIAKAGAVVDNQVFNLSAQGFFFFLQDQNIQYIESGMCKEERINQKF